jgi:hypothetical protein
MRLTLALALGLTVLAVPAAVAADDLPPWPTAFAGDAFDRDGRLRYREFHDVTLDGHRKVRSVTTYRDASGAVIGWMEADYAGSPFSPDYRMIDLRFDIEDTVRREGQRLIMTHRDGTKTREKVVEHRGDRELIIGPGFNEFIRRHWDRLLAGETLRCDFAIPSRQQVIGFRIQHEPLGTSRGTARFEMSVDNALFRLIAPSLAVEYDRETRHLASYEGLSNVTDDRDRPQHVVIRFPSAVTAGAASGSGAERPLGTPQ